MLVAHQARGQATEDWNTTCAGPVQSPLLFGVDAFTAQSVGLPLDPPADETLADAICCDPVYTSYPEPKGLYAEPSVRLFKRIDSTGETTFYDSVSDTPKLTPPVSAPTIHRPRRTHAPRAYRCFTTIGRVLTLDVHSFLRALPLPLSPSGLRPPSLRGTQKPILRGMGAGVTGSRLALLPTGRGGGGQRHYPKRRRDSSLGVWHEPRYERAGRRGHTLLHGPRLHLRLQHEWH